eukprot:6180864-Pleurochrysis_carterae.AAC.5
MPPPPLRHDACRTSIVLLHGGSAKGRWRRRSCAAGSPSGLPKYARRQLCGASTARRGSPRAGRERVRQPRAEDGRRQMLAETNRMGTIQTLRCSRGTLRARITRSYQRLWRVRQRTAPYPPEAR